jgi:hypothetical protein
MMPTYEQVLAMYQAILLDQPVPEGFPDVEQRLRDQIADIEAEGLVAEVPE